VVWTFVTVTFSSDGGKASEIHKLMKELGFRTTLGNFDYVYKWDVKEIKPGEVAKFVEEQLVKLVDRVQAKLEGKKVQLEFRTFKNIR